MKKRNIFLSILFALLFALIFAFVTTDIFKKNFYRVDIQAVYKEKQLLPIVYYIVDNEKNADKNKSYKKLISHDNRKYIESFDVRNIKNIVFYLENNKKNFSLESIKIKNSFFTKNINANEIVKYFNSYNVAINNGYLVPANSNEISFLEGNSQTEQYISGAKSKVKRNFILSIIFIIIPLSVLLFYLVFKSINKLFSKKEFYKELDGIKIVNRLIYLFIFINLLFLHSTILIKYKIVDDYWFTVVPNDYNSLIEFAVSYYKSWNGRYLLNVLVPFFVNHNMIFLIIIHTFITLGMYIYGGKIVSLLLRKDNSGRGVFSLFFYSISMLISFLVLWYSSFWVIGIPNYSWGAAFSIITLYYMLYFVLNGNIKLYKLILIIPAALMAGGIEQSGLVTVTLSTILLIYSIVNKKVSYQFVILYIVILVSLLINLLSPGVSLRYEQEIKTWFPMFKNLSIFTKMIYGYPYTVISFIFKNAYYITLLLVLLMALYSLKEKFSKSIQLFIIFLLGIIIYLKVSYINTTNFTGVSTSIVKGSLTVMNLKYIVLMSMILLALLFMLYYIFKKDKFNLFAIILLFLASITSSYIISFSPTIFASSHRIFYIPSVYYSMVSVMMFGYVLKDINIFENKKHLYVLYAYIAIILFLTLSIYFKIIK